MEVEVLVLITQLPPQGSISSKLIQCCHLHTVTGSQRIMGTSPVLYAFECLCE